MQEGGAVEFVYEPGKISIIPGRRPTRDGWAEDFAALAAADLSQEDIDWLEADMISETDAKMLGSDWTDEEIAALEAALAVTDRDPR